jgi:plasmid stabilization system protein ParE
MACKLIWSPAARDDLRDIVRFIARDNPRRAESFAYELMTRTDILQEHPEAGRIGPEYRMHASARSSFVLIALSTAWMLSENW